ncbi:MAG: YfhO family protein [Planctomycetaceae bacterium]|nr:YfhO family protein [Planctomycetaceae bacterium]
MRFKPAPILIVLAVGTGLTYLFWKLLWLGGGWIGGDMYSYYMPQKLTYQQALERGDWALWNDVVSLGYPQLAESQTGVFYPFHLLFYSTLSLNDAYHINQLVHYIIAFAGMALLARSFGLSLRAALLASLVYVYGWFPPRNCLEWAIIGGAWLPWAIWSLNEFLTTRRRRYLIGLSIFLGLQLLPGHFVIAFLTILTALAFTFARLWWIPAFDADREATPARPGKKLPLLLAVGMAIGCAFLLAGVQLLPTWQLKRDSQRENAVHDVGYGHLPPPYLAQVIMPWKWYGLSPAERDAALNQMDFLTADSSTNQAEAHLYFGLIPLLLAILGILPARESSSFTGSQKAFLWLLALLALTYAFGWWLPITRHLPGFSFFIGPGRYGLITTLAIALLAAESADRWFAKFDPGTRTLAWGLVLALSLADLYIFPAYVRYAVTVADSPIQYRDRSPIRQFLAEVQEQNGQPVRLYAPGANLPSLLEFSSVPEYLGLGPAEYYEDDLSIPAPPALPEGESVLPVDEAFIDWLQRAGVTHLLTEHPLSRDWPAELVLKVSDPFLNACWGRAPNSVHYVSRLDDTRGRWFWEESSGDQSVTLEESLPSRKEYRVSTSSPNRLVITELMSPGWTVAVDDQPAEAVKVEGLFRGVDVPAGEHRIVWTYQPLSFRVGVWVSLATVLFLAAVAHLRFWHPQRLRWLDQTQEPVSSDNQSSTKN